MARVFKQTTAATALFLAGCGGTSPPAPDRDARAPTTPVAAAPAMTPQPFATPVTIDREPEGAATATIVSRRDIAVAGKPACAFEIRYPAHLDQPAVWSGEACADVHARFVTTGELQTLGRLSALPEETREDIAQTHDKVFDVEGQVASAIYPLNEAGHAYKVALAD
jgi:hypothetical protein